MSSILVKTPYYSQKPENLTLEKNGTIVNVKSTSQGEQNGANFSFIAPSSEE